MLKRVCDSKKEASIYIHTIVFELASTRLLSWNEIIVDLHTTRPHIHRVTYRDFNPKVMCAKSFRNTELKTPECRTVRWPATIPQVPAHGAS